MLALTVRRRDGRGEAEGATAMLRGLSRPVTAFVMLLAWAPRVRACPLCESETGRRVRAGIFHADFGYNLLVTMLPFGVFLAILGLIHFRPTRPGITTEGNPQPRKSESETSVTLTGEDRP